MSVIDDRETLPDDILVYDEPFSDLADFGTLVAYPLDCTLRDCTTCIADLADIRVVEIIINDGRCTTCDELPRQDFERIEFGQAWVDVGMLDRGQWGARCGRSDGWLGPFVSYRVGTVASLLVVRRKVDQESRVLASAVD